MKSAGIAQRQSVGRTLPKVAGASPAPRSTELACRDCGLLSEVLGERPREHVLQDMLCECGGTLEVAS
jgi:hypothetical protein